ncbi:MAG: hypothetical protein IKG25_04000 [Mogibacterium sp.]|nr:hypothetical protein [Mogibacterium sp.]
MNIRKQIDEVIEGLSPGECIEALGIMISDIERETEKMSKLARQVFNIPISKIDISPKLAYRIASYLAEVMKMTKALVDRYRARSAQEHSTPMRDDYTR